MDSGSLKVLDNLEYFERKQLLAVLERDRLTRQRDKIRLGEVRGQQQVLALKRNCQGELERLQNTQYGHEWFHMARKAYQKSVPNLYGLQARVFWLRQSGF